MAESIINPQIKKVIEENVIAFATIDSNGNPNVVALACCKVVGNNLVLLSDNYMNKTRSNLLQNKICAFAVWTKDEKKGYQLKGFAEYLTSGNWKDKVDKDPDNDGLAHKAAVLFTVEEIWDLVHPKLIFRQNK